MAITFDGPARLAILNAGTTTLSVVDLYSRWKDWVAAGNAQFLEMFRPVGGEPIDPVAGTSIPLYAFMVNGWRVRPQDANHTLNVEGGILLVDGGGDPFVDPQSAGVVVRVNYRQPVQAITVATLGGSGGGASVADIAAAVVAAMRTAEPPVPVDVHWMNTAEVIGNGTAGNAWRGAGVPP